MTSALIWSKRFCVQFVTTQNRLVACRWCCVAISSSYRQLIDQAVGAAVLLPVRPCGIKMYSAYVILNNSLDNKKIRCIQIYSMVSGQACSSEASWMLCEPGLMLS